MLTLTQLYELGKTKDIDIFDGISLPVNSPLDRDVLINSIIMRCGLNYPNFADPSVMASAITLWSAKNQYTFLHVGKIYTASYSPIENYDRYEDMSTDRDRKLSDDTANRGLKAEHLTSSRDTKHTGTDTTTDESQTSAYDASTYQPVDKTTSDLKHGENINDSGDSLKNTTSQTDTNKNISENELTTQKNHIRGNIGVVTADTMQIEEYSFLEKYNPYDFIAGLFENDLTLFVY